MSTAYKDPKSDSDSGLTIAQLLDQLSALGNYIRKKWLVVLLGVIGFGIAGWLLTLRQDSLYLAELTFALDEKEPNHAQSAFSVFSQQLGLEPVDGGNAFSNARNIEELLKSRLLVENALRSLHFSLKDSVYFFDYFLDSLDLRRKWAPGTEPGRLWPEETEQDTALAKRQEQALMKSMYKKIVNSFLGIQQKSKGSSILNISMSTPHEGFSKHFLEKLVAEVSAYYIESKTRRSKTNLAIIERRNDSIRRAYQAAIRKRAAFSDADINLARELASAPTEKMQTDVQVLKTTYMELSRNLETAKTAVMNETPIIEIIDLPLLPLDKKSPSPLRNFILFSLLGIFLTIGWLTLRWLISLVRGVRDHETDEIQQEFS
jgi:uncharacterized protein involved in exopolysaccharide biosynthesis